MEEYFSSLAQRVDPKLVAAVSAQIGERGFWERTEEWRISTYITSRIEPCDFKGKKWYRVTVNNGTDVSCLCPTISRAVHYLTVIEGLTVDLFYTQGWPSWADKGRLEAEPNEV